MTLLPKTININLDCLTYQFPSKNAVLYQSGIFVYNKRMDNQTKLAIEKSFCGLVDLYGVDRVARMKGISRNQVKKRFLNERDGVERKSKPRKPKVKR